MVFRSSSAPTAAGTCGARARTTPRSRASGSVPSTAIPGSGPRTAHSSPMPLRGSRSRTTGCPATPNAGRPTPSANDDREQGIVGELAQRLAAEADERTRDWWNRYLKGTTEFRGVPMAGIRKIAHALWHEHDLAQWPRARRVDLALTFLAQRYAEEKLAGILVLAERLLPELRAEDISILAKPFERGHIDDWSTCDWYCVKVLARLLGRVDDRHAAAEEIAAWRHADNLWQRRAAAVSWSSRRV